MSASATILGVAERLGAKLKRIGSVGEYAGPCPVCGGRDRFSINARKGVFNCRGCDAGGDDVDLARHVGGMNFADAFAFARGCDPEAKDIRSPWELTERATPLLPVPKAQVADTSVAALDIWRASRDSAGTIVETYLVTRALELDAGARSALRFSTRIGAMVALFRNILTGAPQAVSRTYLDAAAQKVERRFLGPVGGAAIMLDGFADVLGGLHVGEGVETCLAARQLGMRPAWALGSAGAVAAFPILRGVECLTLLAENDSASTKAVEQCAARWHAAGCEVFINRPRFGKDLNDAIRGAA